MQNICVCTFKFYLLEHYFKDANMHTYTYLLQGSMSVVYHDTFSERAASVLLFLILRWASLGLLLKFTHLLAYVY